MPFALGAQATETIFKRPEKRQESGRKAEILRKFLLAFQVSRFVAFGLFLASSFPLSMIP